MLKNLYIHFLLFSLIQTKTTAQLTDWQLLFIASVIDFTSSQNIPYTEVFNERSRTGVMADSTGLFLIFVLPGDTLIFQGMGYLGRVCLVEQIITNVQDTIELCPQAYELGEVSLNFSRSYEQLKHEFLTIKPDRGLEIEGLPKAKIQDIPALLDTNYLNSNGFAIFHPISYPYYMYSKEEKSKWQVFYLERQKREQLLIDKKYNCELIEKMTGLKGDAITEFMDYCTFSHKFLYKAAELEIVEMIDKKFREYKMTKSGKQ